jgi:uncharacterized membrane protein
MNAPSNRFGGQTVEPAGSPAALVPSGGEFTTAWIAYGCFFFGVILWWPSIIGLIISYVRRNEPDTGFIDSHYRWLIGTFWWSTLAWLLSIGLIVGGVLPIVIDVLRSAKQSGQRIGEIDVQTLVSIDWSSIFAAAGLATLGGVSLLGVYVWLLYRLIRGALRLADARPAP